MGWLGWLLYGIVVGAAMVWLGMLVLGFEPRQQWRHEREWPDEWENDDA